MADVRLITAGCVAVLCACGSAPAPTPVPEAPPTAAPMTSRQPPPPSTPLLDAFPSPQGEPKFKRVLSKRLKLSIPLPNRSGWVMKREKSSFLVLEHAATSSTLLVGLWREDTMMNRQRCEQQARLLRELPRRDGEVLSTVDVHVPAGFDTRIDVGFVATGEQPLAGWALAFGGLARECFAFVFTTTAAGDDAERIVGDRLAVMQTLALEGLERRATPTGIGREP